MMTWTDEHTKYVFGALCLVQAAVGSWLGVLALDPSSKSVAQYPYDYHQDATANILGENRAIVDQQEAAVSALSFNRLSQIALVISVVSGLVINFPWLWWLGLLFWLLPVGYALQRWRKMSDAKWRIGVYRMAFERKVDRGWIPLSADVRSELMSVMTAPPKDVKELKAQIERDVNKTDDVSQP